MRKKSISDCGIVFLLFLSVLSGCKDKQEQTHDHSSLGDHQHREGSFVCPMGCQGDKTYPAPGTCPVCNMELVPTKKELVQSESPDRLVLSDQKTIKILSGATGATLKAQGFIQAAKERNVSVAARFGGRIEKLYVKYGNQVINKGEKIMEIYSPSLRTIQEEHLLLVKVGDRNENLIRQSRERLYLLGISETQVLELENEGRVTASVTIFSPASGYVSFDPPSITPSSTDATSGALTDGMGMARPAGAETPFAAPGMQIREGMYVNQGQTLFNVNDLMQVWALVSVPNGYVGQIQENQMIRIFSEIDPGTVLEGKMSLKEQVFEEEGQRFIRIRVILPNKGGHLKINSLVEAEIPLGSGREMMIPSSAVYKTGKNAYVWVKSGTADEDVGIFKARKVVSGVTVNGLTTITYGLTPDMEIALQAGLMTDSETFIREY